MGNITLIQDNDSKENLNLTMVYLDGEFLSKLSKDGDLKFKVKAGKHNIKLKQGLFVSPDYEVDIKDYEDVSIVIGTNYKAKSTINTALTPIVFFGGVLYNYYYLKSTMFYIVVILCSAALLIFEGYKVKFKGMLYYLTIGRKQYFDFQIKKRR